MAPNKIFITDRTGHSRRAAHARTAELLSTAFRSCVCASELTFEESKLHSEMDLFARSCGKLLGDIDLSKSSLENIGEDNYGV